MMISNQDLTQPMPNPSHLTQPGDPGSPVDIDMDKLRKAVLVLRALNHDLRRRIIDLLYAEGHLTVTDIFVALRIEQSVASQHLAVLRKADIVVPKRDGKFIFYEVAPKRLLEIKKVITNLSD